MLQFLHGVNTPQYIYFFASFFCMCYSQVSTFTVLSEIVKNIFATLPAVCRKEGWPKKACDMSFLFFLCWLSILCSAISL
jgi:hypothetical protein